MLILNLNIRTWSLLLALAPLTTSCTVVEEPLDPITRAEWFLNHQHYDQAIAVLRPLAIQNPKVGRVSLLLGSAYAASAGINILDAFEALAPRFFDKMTIHIEKVIASIETSSTSEQNTPNEQVDKEIADQDATDADGQSNLDQLRRRRLLGNIETQIRLNFNQLAEVFEVAHAVPYLDADSRRDVVRALNAVQSVEHQDPYFESAKLYAAVLSLIQFINYLRDSVAYIGIHNSDTKILKSLFCQSRLQEFFESVSKTILYADLSIKYIRQSGRFSDHYYFRSIEAATPNIMAIHNQYRRHYRLLRLVDRVHNFSKDSLCNAN